MIDILTNQVQRLHGDERATSLTEFVIVLPIFLMILSFIIQMGGAGNVLTAEWTGVQRDLWAEVRNVQRMSHDPITGGDPAHIHTHPGSAADEALLDLQANLVRNSQDDLVTPVRQNEERTFRGLRDSGHWGESYQRTRSADAKMNLFPAHSGRSVTAASSNVVGSSGYARRIVDDSPGTTPINHEGSSGLPVAIAAGIRYGVVSAIREGTMNFSGGLEFETSVRAEFNVLVPPQPPANAGQAAREITRGQLDSYQPYSKLLGIDHPQPLPSESAPSIPTDWSTQE